MPLVQIHLLKGRSPEEQKKLLAAVTQAIHDSIGAPMPTIRVWINEMSPDGYMVAGELASERKKPST